ncbi:MAG: pseudaminic acid cytidylyltransferase [Lachnospiraceae bacterium]|nr:pseudaminic acid cytidylyltransferase [Lachnospiraceae bacterium]
MENKKRLAVITARGGSKRIPKKNIRDFLGKPIISYSIETAISCGIFDEVMVSTDSKEIAELAESYGAKVPFMRSEKTADDHATTAEVLKEVVEEYEKRGMFFDELCCIYPTAPFIRPEDLKEALTLLEDKDADTVMSVVRFSFPPRRALLMREGRLIAHYPEDQLKRSQDLEAEYHDCGQFYFLKLESFKEQQAVVMKNTAGIEMDERRVQDIDTEEDWAMAELKYKMLTEQGR